MANTNSRPLPTVGVDMYTFFPITNEDETGKITYGTAVSLPGTVQISPTDSGGTETFDADNGAYENMAYLEKIGHELTNADITPEIDAMWRGLAKKENGLVEVGETKTPYFGVAWRTEKSDGSYRYVRYYKGSYSFASNVGGKTKPSNGAPEFQTASATYTAVKRESDDMYYCYIDEADIPQSVTKEEFERQWFTTPDYEPGVTE